MLNVLTATLVIVVPIAACAAAVRFAGEPERCCENHAYVGVNTLMVESFANAYPVNRELCDLKQSKPF